MANVVFGGNMWYRAFIWKEWRPKSFNSRNESKTNNQTNPMKAENKKWKRRN